MWNSSPSFLTHALPSEYDPTKSYRSAYTGFPSRPMWKYVPPFSTHALPSEYDPTKSYRSAYMGFPSRPMWNHVPFFHTLALPSEYGPTKSYSCIVVVHAPSPHTSTKSAVSITSTIFFPFIVSPLWKRVGEVKKLRGEYLAYLYLRNSCLSRFLLVLLHFAVVSRAKKPPDSAGGSGRLTPTLCCVLVLQRLKLLHRRFLHLASVRRVPIHPPHFFKGSGRRKTRLQYRIKLLQRRFLNPTSFRHGPIHLPHFCKGSGERKHFLHRRFLHLASARCGRKHPPHFLKGSGRRKA